MKRSRLFIVLTALSGLLITSCDNYQNPSSVEFEVSDLGEVNIHSQIQDQLLNSDDPDQFVYDYAYPNNQNAVESNSFPNSFTISYTINSNNKVKPRKVYVYVGETEYMTNYMKFEGSMESADIYNLKVHTTYYYQVVAHYVSDFASEVHSFTVTTPKVRNIYVEGVENVRDLGGWDIGENRTYKQGLIYRTGQFNYGGAHNTYECAPTKEGIKTLKEQLKVKTEIDLREVRSDYSVDEVNGITSSPLGKDVKYVSAPMLYRNTDIFENKYNKDSLKIFFEALADESNYPIAFHCLRGTDRTGGLAYVIGALVGMSPEDLMLDYLFSNLAKIGSVVRKFSIDGKYVTGIEEAEGNSYAEKAKNYLLSKVEITSQTIDKIIDILVD